MIASAPTMEGLLHARMPAAASLLAQKVGSLEQAARTF
jgi:hypothetical protein